MKAKREYRNREEVEVAVLDALVDRSEEGMTVFEIRSRVDADIDDLETALANLKEDGLISANEGDHRTLITPDERVIPDPDAENPEEPSYVDRIIDRLPF
jgi:predicted transcriptional regulator